MQVSIRKLWHQGLWQNNPGLVQLLGLCPLLAVTNTTINGLGLGLATLFVLVCSSAAVSLVRNGLMPEIRIPAFVLIIATIVTVVDLGLQAGLPELSRTLGIFVPLIVTNCTILARAEAFASRQPLLPAVHDAAAQGLGFALVLVALGAVREIIGMGTLFAGADLLLGDWAAGLSIRVLPEGFGLLLALLPPGAFIALGLMVALRQHLVSRQRTQPATATLTSAPSAQT